jgi:hypothetical protein
MPNPRRALRPCLVPRPKPVSSVQIGVSAEEVMGPAVALPNVSVVKDAVADALRVPWRGLG